MDFKRGAIRLYLKIVREQATPEYIARGWAIGMFYGCFIPFGLQLICSIPTAFLMRGSKIGATVGTLITNHVSIFFIYPAQCYVGSKIIGGDLSYTAIKNVMAGVIKEQSFSSLFALGGELAAAFFIGGGILAAVMTPITYIFVKKLVIGFNRRRERKHSAAR